MARKILHKQWTVIMVSALENTPSSNGVVTEKKDSRAASHSQSLEKIFNRPPETVNYLVNWSTKYSYIYVETPKVACTTIKRVLQNAEAEHEIVRKNMAAVHDRKSSPLLAPLDDLELFSEALSNERFATFCFVRNPYSRVLSCYLDKVVANKKEWARICPILGFKENDSPTLKLFLEAVAELPDHKHDIHWAPQTLILRPNRIKYSFIGRFEIFKRDFSLLCEFIGIKKFLDELPDTVHATGANMKLKQYIGEDEVKLIRHIYQNDFRNFGYGWNPYLAG